MILNTGEKIDQLGMAGLNEHHGGELFVFCVTHLRRKNKNIKKGN